MTFALKTPRNHVVSCTLHLDSVVLTMSRSRHVDVTSYDVISTVVCSPRLFQVSWVCACVEVCLCACMCSCLSCIFLYLNDYIHVYICMCVYVCPSYLHLHTTLWHVMYFDNHQNHFLSKKNFFFKLFTFFSFQL